MILDDFEPDVSRTGSFLIQKETSDLETLTCYDQMLELLGVVQILRIDSEEGV